MKWLNHYIIGVAFLSDLRSELIIIGLVIVLCVRVGPAESAETHDTEVVIMIAGHEYRYQPRPDIGYVVAAQNDRDAIISVQRDLNLFDENQIKYVGGYGSRGFWIIERKQSTSQNQALIGRLSSREKIHYVAPLFSRNGEIETIIPEIVIRATDGTKTVELRQICQMLNLEIKRKMMFTEQEYLVDVLGDNADSVFAALFELNQIESVEWAAPNVIAQRNRPEAPISKINNSEGNIYLYNAPLNFSSTGFIPDDEYFPMQWHLNNTGQFGGKTGADINALSAWEITTGDPNIVVCVHDTGVDLDHPDLVKNLVPGYDSYDNDYVPEPVLNYEDAHGTACAGLVAAQGNNSIGVVGVAWNCKVMPIRDGTYYSTNLAGAAEGFRWAAANGADVVSYSTAWSNHPIIHSAIVDITKPGGIGRNGKGCVVFAAAGNRGKSVQYPAAHPEVIAVGATDPNDKRFSYSNFGPNLDIVTPSGEWNNHIIVPQWTTDIVGSGGYNRDNTDPSILDYTDAMGLTSGACPLAAGVAALILSVEPELTNEEVRHFLCRSAKDLGEPGRDDYYGWGRVDARAALDMVLAARADLYRDGKVDMRDLLVLIEHWRTDSSSADIAPATKRDGVVDNKDLELMMQYWHIEYPEFGLAAHFKLDDTEGIFAADSAGDNDAFVVGGALWQPGSGQVDGALQFDGIDDYVETPFILNPSKGPLSVFAWIKGGAPGQVIISQTGDFGGTWLGTNPSSKLMTGFGDIYFGALVSDTVITDGQWHHVVFVYDMDSLHRRLYVDGVLVAEDTTFVAGMPSDGGLYIGASKDLDAGTFFSGMIDDVRIYNQALSAEEIATLAN